MFKKIVIVQGHPDERPDRFCRVLAERYRRSATEAGHGVRVIDVARLDFPLLRSKDDFEKLSPPPAVENAQSEISAADHLLVIYPMWLGDVPALLKGFFEQVFRPGFAFQAASGRGFPTKLLKGKTAHIVVTMGMPAFFYRWYFGAHGLKNLERNILKFCGFGPITQSVIGMIEDENPTNRERWLRKIEECGRRGD